MTRRSCARTFRGEPLDPDADWEAAHEEEQYKQLLALLTRLRKRMKARFNRHVSTGNLLHDRWELADEYGFGAGTSLYDDSLILGDVTVREKCWVGPQCVLDGSGGLVIGDYVDIGSGSQIYSHNTIERSLPATRCRSSSSPPASAAAALWALRHRTW